MNVLYMACVLIVCVLVMDHGVYNSSIEFAEDGKIQKAAPRTGTVNKDVELFRGAVWVRKKFGMAMHT